MMIKLQHFTVFILSVLVLVAKAAILSPSTNDVNMFVQNLENSKSSNSTQGFNVSVPLNVTKASLNTNETNGGNSTIMDILKSSNLTQGFNVSIPLNVTEASLNTTTTEQGYISSTTESVTEAPVVFDMLGRGFSKLSGYVSNLFSSGYGSESGRSLGGSFWSII
ncbi:uncharacterized protein [Chelonus insularis]|uniref:uncharacterized protein n=1 Tax=Chelonus insularis TaxID=460826 RepID=UPI00158B67D2|nr:uncharacterized protein LOC118064865 [Chelonus insularis]